MTDFMTRFSTPHRGKADKRRVSRGVFCLLVIEESHLTGLCLEGKRTKLTVCCVMLLPAPFLAASEGETDSTMPDHEDQLVTRELVWSLGSFACAKAHRRPCFHLEWVCK